MNYQQICSDAQAIVRRAGDFIRQEFGKVNRQTVEEKSQNQLVSYVDRKAEVILVEGLGKLVPEATFLTEEQTVENKPSDLQWIIDPLDGTTNFLYGIPTFAVSVALRQGDKIVVGIVYEINRDECFYAWQGGGAWLNGDAIRVSSTQDMAKAMIATGFPADSFGRLVPLMKSVSYFVQNAHSVRRIGSAATDLAYTACGRFDTYFEYNLQPWDAAAGILLVQEAGGVVSDFSGSDHYLQGREMLAGNPNIHEQSLKIIRQAFYPTMSSV